MEKDKVVILGKHIGEFLKNKDLSSAKKKMALIASIHAAERWEDNPLQLKEEEYDLILEAITTGKFVIDTGRYYINVGAPVGREEFLHQQSFTTDSDGKEYRSWDFESFDVARPFTREEIDTIVPKPYRSEDYLVMENIALERWGKPLVESVTPTVVGSTDISQSVQYSSGAYGSVSLSASEA